MIKIVLLTLTLITAVFSSGKKELVELSSRISKENSSVFVIKLIDFTPIEIKELKEEGVRKFATIVEITDILNSGTTPASDEEWSINFENSEIKSLPKYRVEGKPEVGDTVIIMNGEDISRSFTYYVKEMRKIFNYYYSPLAAETPLLTDRKYIFISQESPSKKSGVYYGNIGYGFYPDNSEIRSIIEKKIGL